MNRTQIVLILFYDNEIDSYWKFCKNSPINQINVFIITVVKDVEEKF